MKDKINYSKCLFLDIETSYVRADDGTEIQVPYLTNVLIVDADNHKIISSKFHRTMKDTIDYLNYLTVDERLICFAHNLQYELYHILRETGASTLYREDMDIYGMNKSESIFRDVNAPLSIKLDALPNIEFRDSLALFNKGVAKLGEDLGLPKLGYDYKVLRLPTDELTQLDYDYNERDNVIVAESFFKRWKERGETLETTPLTFTASTKKDRAEFLKENFTKNEVYSLSRDAKNVYESEDFYNLQVKAFQGGLTTANKNLFNRMLTENVVAIDITSSYPYQIVSRRFPLYSKDCTSHLRGEVADRFFNDYLKDITVNKIGTVGCLVKGYIAMVKINNIKIKNDDYLLPINFSNCVATINEKQINGKIYSADAVVIAVDNVAFTWIKMCYDFESVSCVEAVVTTKDRYLRKGEVSFILNNFRKKQTLKGVEGMEIEYALAKVNCNNLFGCKVQKPLKDRIDIIDGVVSKIEFQKCYDNKDEIYQNFLIDKHNRIQHVSGKNFDIFTDGIYITSYARYMLLDMMVTLTNQGDRVIYADTDSLKIISKDVRKTQDTVEKTNNIIVNKNSNLFRFKEYKEKFEISKKDFDVICGLGTWDFECNFDEQGNIIPYDGFKTLGAKKYAYITGGKIKTTIAGCSKNVSKAMTKYAENNNVSLVDATDLIFASGTMFDESCSGRTVAEKDDRPREECYRKTYNGTPLYSAGGIVIKDTSYTLGVSQNDANMLDIRRYKEAYIVLNDKGELMDYDKFLLTRRTGQN